MNGMTSVPVWRSSGGGEQEEVAVVVADSYNDQLIRVDFVAGQNEVVLDVLELYAHPNATFLYNDHTYWPNFERLTIDRIAIDRNGYPLKSETVSTITTIPEIQGIDDFGTDSYNENNTYQSAAGGIGSLLLPSCTASAWGRGKNHKNILYVTTNGGMVSPINGTIVEPAKVAAVDTSQFVI
ncbi:unnamed protein product [Clonostachys solani]|uniref:Uncharacterized protein n=1 Tax=Clonostachys solani TaxID=160281 RepID=A0A9N9ZK95_9HYPO|nr:unnamed protein product [Clonostachys solani]